MSESPKSTESVADIWRTLIEMRVVRVDDRGRIPPEELECIDWYIKRVVEPIEQEFVDVEERYGTSVADRVFYAALEDLLRDVGFTEQAIADIRRKPLVC